VRRSNLTRRSVLRTAALGAAAASFSPYVRHAYSAGKLALALWDHWIPGANASLSEMCRQWASENHVELQIDFVPTTQAANTEAQTRTGHDVVAHPMWQILLHQRMLEPVDEVMLPLLEAYGPVSPVAEYLGRHDGIWRGVPATVASQLKTCCSRLDLYRQHCGLDVAKLFPPGGDDLQADSWTWARYLRTAQQLFKAGSPVGLPMGQTSDSIDWTGALFRAFGAVFVDASGTIKLDSDESRAALEVIAKLMAANASEVYGWDDTDNNRWLISGRGSGIINPPSAWVIAKQTNPLVAKQCWTHDLPRGPYGRFVPHLPFFYGIWSFAENKSAAKDFLSFISQRPQVERLVTASNGIDMPAFSSFLDFETWMTAGPPAGTLSNYPPRKGATATVAGFPARPELASQIYHQALQPAMVTRLTQRGESIDSVIQWAERELEGMLCRRSSPDCA
jgi:Bacterial extracellular solute-binding protein